MKFKYYRPHIGINKLMKDYMEVEENKERVDRYFSKSGIIYYQFTIF